MNVYLQENPAVILSDLRAIKAKHAKLFLELKEINAAQKQSMNSVRTSMNCIMELSQHLQCAPDVEVASPTEHTAHPVLTFTSKTRSASVYFNIN